MGSSLTVTLLTGRKHRKLEPCIFIETLARNCPQVPIYVDGGPRCLVHPCLAVGGPPKIPHSAPNLQKIDGDYLAGNSLFYDW